VEDKTISIELSPNSPEPNPPSAVLEIWGQNPLSGQINVSGSKNSALAIIAGVILCSQECRLRNVPNLIDVTRMSQILTILGIKVNRSGDTLDFDVTNLKSAEAPYDIVSKLRASFFVIGPLLARLGVARVPLPGGCAIGARPVDLHVKGLRELGASVIIENGIVQAAIPGKKGRLKGTKIYLDYPSVGATETIMMAATLADGETIIENAACEPEVIDLANFCIAMGAKIQGAGTNTIVISGVESLHSCDYEVIPDRIEAGTFLVAAAITKSPLSVFPVISEHLAPVIAKLQAIGIQVVKEGFNTLRVIPGELKATDLETLPYPGFPTDMQAQFMALLCLSEGNSLITETVFENRMLHVAELKRMGADIRTRGNHVIVNGVPLLSGAPVMATDLRASAALVLAGLAAKGKTTVQGLHHLDRGYEHLDQKLAKVGAKIRRLEPGRVESLTS